MAVYYCYNRQMEITFKSFAPLTPVERRGPRVLVVDDDHDSMVKTTELLREVNATISTAASGKEAIEWFLSETPLDLVLLDLYMPDMNGFETFDAIRETDWYCARRIPVIAVSSNMLAEPKQKFLKSTGFKDYVTKPLRRETFIPMIRHHAPYAHIDPTAAWY